MPPRAARLTDDTMSEFEQRNTTQARLNELSATCSEIIDRAVRDLQPRTIFGLDKDEQQALIDRLNAYLSFEMSQMSDLKGTPICVDGYGMMFAATDGVILGAEVMAGDAIVSGFLDDIWAFPVPTLECVKLSSTKEIPVIDEALSAMLMLVGATYKGGRMPDGTYEVEHDLTDLEVAIPLAHSLNATVTHP